MTLAPGTRIGEFQVVAALGAGGVSEVLRATDTRRGREEALAAPPETAIERRRGVEDEVRPWNGS